MRVSLFLNTYQIKGIMLRRNTVNLLGKKYLVHFDFLLLLRLNYILHIFEVFLNFGWMWK